MNLPLILRRFIRGFEVSIEELEAIAGKLRWKDEMTTVTISFTTFQMAKVPVEAFVTHARGRTFPSTDYHALVVTTLVNDHFQRVEVTLKRKAGARDAA